MKNSLCRTFVAAAICVTAGFVALAGEKVKNVTFLRDVNVNGTVVKKGEYKIKFDETSGEMMVMKGKVVVAKAPARLESRSGKANRTEVILRQENGENRLRAIAFEGDGQNISLSEAAAAPQQ